MEKSNILREKVQKPATKLVINVKKLHYEERLG